MRSEQTGHTPALEKDGYHEVFPLQGNSLCGLPISTAPIPEDYYQFDFCMRDGARNEDWESILRGLWKTAQLNNYDAFFEIRFWQFANGLRTVDGEGCRKK